jgi:hypothetical protein
MPPSLSSPDFLCNYKHCRCNVQDVWEKRPLMITRQEGTSYFSSVMGMHNLEDILINAAEDETFAETLLFKNQMQVYYENPFRAYLDGERASQRHPVTHTSSPSYPRSSNGVRRSRTHMAWRDLRTKSFIYVLSTKHLHFFFPSGGGPTTRNLECYFFLGGHPFFVQGNMSEACMILFCSFVNLWLISCFSLCACPSDFVRGYHGRHPCMPTCMNCIRGCVCTTHRNLYALHTCIFTCMHTCVCVLHAYMHTCVHTHMQAHL